VLEFGCLADPPQCPLFCPPSSSNIKPRPECIDFYRFAHDAGVTGLTPITASIRYAIGASQLTSPSTTSDVIFGASCEGFRIYTTGTSAKKFHPCVVQVKGPKFQSTKVSRRYCCRRDRHRHRETHSESDRSDNNASRFAAGLCQVKALRC